MHKIETSTTTSEPHDQRSVHLDIQTQQNSKPYNDFTQQQSFRNSTKLVSTLENMDPAKF